MKKLLLIVLIFLLGLAFFYCRPNNNYTFNDEWGEEGTGDGQFNSPRGIFVFPDVYAGSGLKGSTGSVFITDTFNHRVEVFSLSGSFIGKFGSYGTQLGQFNQPRGVAINLHITPDDIKGSTGSVFITDTFNHRVQVFNLDTLDFMWAFGSQGSGEVQFNQPDGIAVTPITIRGSTGSVFITDTFNHRIEVLSLDGKFLREFGTEGSGEGKLNKPSDIAIAPYTITTKGSTGSVFITDTFNHRIQSFTFEGDFLDSFGSKGSGEGQFNEPKGIAIDLLGNIYVADSGNNRIQVFDRDGNFIIAFGELGSGEGQFDDPEDVSLDADGTLYVVDTGNHRIQTFEPTQPVLRGFDITLGGDPSAGLPVKVNVVAKNQSGGTVTEFNGEVTLYTSNPDISIDSPNISITNGTGSKDIVFSSGGDTKLLLPYGYLLSESSTFSVDTAKIYVSVSSGNDSNTGTQTLPKATISAAITAIASYKPAEVIVAEGTYNESIVLVEGVSLRGGYDATTWVRDIDANITIIQDLSTGGTSASPIFAICCDSAITNNTIVDGFTINSSTNAGALSASAIYLNGGSPIISRNRITTANGVTTYGVYGISSTNAIIRNCEIVNGNASSTYGIYLTNSSVAQVYNNVIIGGSGIASGYCIYSGSSSAFAARNNTMYLGTSPLLFGIYLELGPNAVIENNIISSGGTGIGIYENGAGNDPVSLRNNNIYNCASLYFDNGITITLIADVNALANASGNISVDSNFIGGNDFHLQATSDVQVRTGGIDGASPIEDWGYAYDKDNVDRTGNGVTGWSLGAYEFD